jgi:hypothetical protein
LESRTATIERAAVMAGSFAARATQLGLRDDVKQEAALAGLEFAERPNQACDEEQFRQYAGRHIKTQLTRYLDDEQRHVGYATAAHYAQMLGKIPSSNLKLHAPMGEHFMDQLEQSHIDWQEDRDTLWADLEDDTRDVREEVAA